MEGSSSKFWEVWVEGVNMYTQYGRIGSKGQTTVKAYARRGSRAESRRQDDRGEDGEGVSGKELSASQTV